MKIGIYKITNIVNGKIYIGSSINLKHRISEHKWKLRTGKHNNRPLLNAWNKYGSDNFKFEVIENLVDNSNIEERELFWMEHYKSYDPKIGYNICVKPYSGIKAPKICINCKQPRKPLRIGRCHACNTYFDRHKEERPYKTDGRKENGIDYNTPCLKCKRPLNSIRGNQCKGYCNSCDTYKRRLAAKSKGQTDLFS